VLDSIPHRSGPFKGSKESLFEYFQNVEGYPKRYSRYCESVEIIDKSDNTITTKEFWNISLDKDVDHVLIKVRYELIPYTEIRYEIMEANLARLIGIKNRMKFSDLQDNPYSNLVIDILKERIAESDVNLYYDKDRGRHRFLSELIENLNIHKRKFGPDEKTVAQLINRITPLKEQADSSAHNITIVQSRKDVLEYPIDEIIELTMHLKK
jgi:hypothetical protein